MPARCGPDGLPAHRGSIAKGACESEALLLQKDELIHRQQLLKPESDHRLLNDLQMTISLLSLQSVRREIVRLAERLAATLG
jgi:two-component sensor histidine kinase